MRTRGYRAHRAPGIPCALNSERAGINEYLAQKKHAARAQSHAPNVIARESNSSSRRRPGPITTGFSCCAKAVEQRLSTRATRRDGVDGPLRHQLCQNEVVANLKQGSRP